MAGLVAAFIFAVQMLNFPVASGTSGHLLGGLLAAVLVGPYAGAVCVAVVLLVQALFFADGGLSAYGLNVLNMALITAYGGYAIFLVMRKAMPATKTSVTIAAGVAGMLSVILASLGFVLEYALGGTGTASVATVAAAMVGVHTLIGIGEGIITALTVGVVLGVRPDLVYGAQDLLPELEMRPVESAR
jgi:cobalt/nickel transport system permease protein